MSKHAVHGGDVAGLLVRFSGRQKKAQVRGGRIFPIIVIQEAELDGFWIHRVLEAKGIERHVVDPASIATSRRRCRQVKKPISSGPWFAHCFPINVANHGCAP